MSEIFKLETEDEGYFTPCPDGKIRGGIAFSKTNWGPVGWAGNALLEGDFSLGFDCICGTEVLIPIPVGSAKTLVFNFLKSKGPRWILKLGILQNRALWKIFKERGVEKLRKAVAAAAAKKTDAFLKYAPRINEMRGLMKQINRLDAAMAPIKERIKLLKSKKNKYATIFNNSIEQLQKMIWPETVSKSDSFWRNFSISTDVTGPEIDLYNKCAAAFKKYSQYKDEVAATMAENAQKIAEYDELVKRRKEIEALSKKFHDADRELSELEWQKTLAENADNGPAMEQALDSLPPEKAITLGESLVDAIFFVLEVLTLVQEKNCLGNQTGLPDGLLGAELNPNTCKCTNCPPRYKSLCDLSSWVGDTLPSGPGTRQSDEFNVCMECCDNAKPKAKWYTGGIIGYTIQEVFSSPPCSCECPEDFEGYKMEWVDCEGENSCERGIFTSDKKACRRKEFHYTGMNYSWDPEVCAYTCNEPCGSDCCVESEYCVDGICGQCPPGQKARLVPLEMLAQETGYMCFPDCSDTAHSENACPEGLCCTVNIFENNVDGSPVFDCIPCPDKTHSLRFEAPGEEFGDAPSVFN